MADDLQKEGLSLWDAFDEYCVHVWRRPEGLGSHDRNAPPFWRRAILRSRDDNGPRRSALHKICEADLSQPIVNVSAVIGELASMAAAGNLRWGGRCGSSVARFDEMPPNSLRHWCVQETYPLDEILLEWETGQLIYEPRFLGVFSDNDRKLACDRAVSWLIQTINSSPNQKLFRSKNEVYQHLKKQPNYTALRPGRGLYAFENYVWKPSVEQACSGHVWSEPGDRGASKNGAA